jgi:hypothetical protein
MEIRDFIKIDLVMRIQIFILTILFSCSIGTGLAQTPAYWNKNSVLATWRAAPDIKSVVRVDIDGDGDPDLIRAILNDSIPIVWIDDDDDMKIDAEEGDTDADCLLIDRNHDGIFAGPYDFCIDWIDTNADGRADIQLIINNAGLKLRNYFDWGADFMYIMDEDQDQIMHYVDWNKIQMRAWEHSGQSNFYKDYHGNTTFLKMHASTFRIAELPYNWENPFIFFDDDKDGLTEMAIRLVDSPVFRDSTKAIPLFQNTSPEYDVQYTKRIDYAALTWDLDNDNAPGNEFDFDMSILFKGKGFSYEKLAHRFPTMKGPTPTQINWYDKRWREIDTLYYPDRKQAQPLIFKQGDWQECRLVFDEDDDCNRWERVEFYDPKDLFKTGREKGGLDHNGQADVVGDRGEFDQDNSGKGELYIAPFDARIHLFGAEWGAWRIDQQAYAYQGFGGLYEKWNKGRLQVEPTTFGTVLYKDTDGNGFIDEVQYDLNGDHQFEQVISFKALGISDQQTRINLVNSNTASMQALFKQVANLSWEKAQFWLSYAKKQQLNTQWYAFYQKPKSMHQKYEDGFWLSFYIYQDLRFQALQKGDSRQVNTLDYLYYSGKKSITQSMK